jgi:integrase/recombinase XerD
MTDETVSPLRRRMIEDMTIRKFAPKTQHDYVQRVKNFAAFLGRSPDRASFEDVRRYQLHLAASGVGVPTINQTVSTLRFFFRVTLKRYEIVEHTHVIGGISIPSAFAVLRLMINSSCLRNSRLGRTCLGRSARRR